MCVIYLFSALQLAPPAPCCGYSALDAYYSKDCSLLGLIPALEKSMGVFPSTLEEIEFGIEPQSSIFHVSIELSRVSGCARKELLVLQLLNVNINQQSKYKRGLSHAQ